MATSFPTFTAANYGEDKATRLERVEGLRDRDVAGQRVPFQVVVAEQTTAATTDAVLATIYVNEPDWADYVYAEVEAYVTSGTGTIKLKDSGGSAGTGATVTATAYAWVGPFSLDVSGGLTNLQIVGSVAGGGTLYVRVQNALTFWWSD